MHCTLFSLYYTCLVMYLSYSGIIYIHVCSTKREDILQQLRTFSGGRNTVPQIFFNSEHIGGNDDLYALEEAGLLAPKVVSIRTTPVSLMMDHWYHPWY